MNQYKERPPILSGPGGKAVSAVLWILGQIVFIIITMLLSKSRIDNSNPEWEFITWMVLYSILAYAAVWIPHIFMKRDIKEDNIDSNKYRGEKYYGGNLHINLYLLKSFTLFTILTYFMTSIFENNRGSRVLGYTQSLLIICVSIYIATDFTTNHFFFQNIEKVDSNKQSTYNTCPTNKAMVHYTYYFKWVALIMAILSIVYPIVLKSIPKLGLIINPDVTFMGMITALLVVLCVTLIIVFGYKFSDERTGPNPDNCPKSEAYWENTKLASQTRQSRPSNKETCKQAQENRGLCRVNEQISREENYNVECPNGQCTNGFCCKLCDNSDQVPDRENTHPSSNLSISCKYE